MPLTPSISVAATINPAAVVVSDTSSGSDVAITSRQITVYDSTNAVINTFAFPLAVGDDITISVFDLDTAANFVVTWLDTNSAVLYTASELFVGVGYNQAFLYNLTQAQTGNPNIIRDKRYYNAKIAIIVEVYSAQEAIAEASDLAGAEFAITRANYFVSNANYFF